MIDRNPFSTRSPYEQVEIARRQRLVVVGSMTSAVFGVALSLFVLFLLLPPSDIYDITALVLCIGVIPFSLLARWLANHGRPTLAAYTLLIYIVILLCINSLLIEGLTPVMVPGFLLLIVLSGVMLRPVHSYTFAALAIVGYLSVRSISANFNSPVDLGIERLDLTLLFMVLMAFVFTAVLNNLLTRDLRRALDDATVEMMRMNEQVQLASDRKSQFTARTSHELRTPLSAIIVFADLALRGAYGQLDERMQNAQQHIVNSARHLKRIINDLLDLSKIEAGEFEIENKPYPVKDIVEMIESTCLPIAREKELDWSIIIDQSMPPILKGDCERVSQIAVNLVGNAVKFTDEGRVEVLIEPVDSKMWHLVVKDTGPGIPEDQRETVFEAYRSLDKTGSKSVAKSTGLGLAIARNLTQMMEGEITLKTELGEGSTFEVCLPLQVPKEDQERIEAIA